MPPRKFHIEWPLGTAPDKYVAYPKRVLEGKGEYRVTPRDMKCPHCGGVVGRGADVQQEDEQ